jgi:hypothetical protein
VSEQRTREEHLAWCKKRALEYLPDAPTEAFTSFASDMRKHPETKGAETFIGMSIMCTELFENPAKMESWIKGFN